MLNRFHVKKCQERIGLNIAVWKTANRLANNKPRSSTTNLTYEMGILVVYINEALLAQGIATLTQQYNIPPHTQVAKQQDNKKEDLQYLFDDLFYNYLLNNK